MKTIYNKGWHTTYHDLQDIIQDVSLSIWRTCVKWNRDMDTLQKPLLYRMVKFAIVDWLRKQPGWSRMAQANLMETMSIEHFKEAYGSHHNDTDAPEPELVTKRTVCNGHPFVGRYSNDPTEQVETDDLCEYLSSMLRRRAHSIVHQRAAGIFDELAAGTPYAQIPEKLGIRKEYMGFIKTTTLRPIIEAAYASIANR